MQRQWEVPGLPRRSPVVTDLAQCQLIRSSEDVVEYRVPARARHSALRCFTAAAAVDLECDPGQARPEKFRFAVLHAHLGEVLRAKVIRRQVGEVRSM